jgi:hypothetical protein
MSAAFLSIELLFRFQGSKPKDFDGFFGSDFPACDSLVDRFGFRGWDVAFVFHAADDVGGVSGLLAQAADVFGGVGHLAIISCVGLPWMIEGCRALEVATAANFYFGVSRVLSTAFFNGATSASHRECKSSCRTALVSDPAHALVATVPVGNAPVGLAVLDQGRRIVVANSSRFGGKGGQELTVISASRVKQGSLAVDGTVAVGHFPRELHATDDGKTLLVTDFDSDQIELLSVDQLPAEKDANLDATEH